MGLQMDFAKLTSQDVLDIAMYAELEAQEYYEGVADEMDRTGNGESAAFFRRMAGLEKLHHDQIAGHRRRLFGSAPATITNSWIWEIESPGGGASPAVHSLLDALNIALDGETRAHDYYAAAKDFVTDPQVEALFEDLRLSEVGHQNMLREEIRRVSS